MNTAGHLKGRWDDEDRALLRALGDRVSKVIHGEDLELPDLQRRDELGILANMVSRMARQLGAARRRDQRYHAELELRVEQLQAAYRTQEKLLATIRELSSPVLEPHEGVVLLPIVGALDAARIAHVIPALIDRIAERRPQVVILHVTCAGSLTYESTALLRRVEQAAFQFGARLLLSGVPSEDAVGGLNRSVCPEGSASTFDMSRLTLCGDLQEALTTALDLVGYRITR